MWTQSTSSMSPSTRERLKTIETKERSEDPQKEAPTVNAAFQYAGSQILSWFVVAL
jgi:hypothetical protein